MQCCRSIRSNQRQQATQPAVFGLTQTEKGDGVGAFANNYLNERAHAFAEALTKHREAILVYN